MPRTLARIARRTREVPEVPVSLLMSRSSGRAGQTATWPTLDRPLYLQIQCLREVAATADVELPVALGEVHLDRLHGEKELLRDLGVRQAFRCHVGYAPFARRQRIGPALDLAVDANATGPKLRAFTGP